jgi:hypothetical protein
MDVGALFCGGALKNGGHRMEDQTAVTIGGDMDRCSVEELYGNSRGEHASYLR